MIQILDTDLPITVAEKIVTGVKPFNGSALSKSVAKVLTGDDNAVGTIDMFSRDEIREIARHLMVYCDNIEND